MRVFAIVAMLFISTLIVSGYDTKAYAQTEKTKTTKKQVTKTVTIKSGDTLTKVAKKNSTTYLRIFYANKTIKDPNVIYPGNKVGIPAKDAKLKKRPLPGAVKPTVVTQVTPTNDYKPVATPAPQTSYNGGSGVWDRLAQCESGGNWSINTGNGYYGGLQFTASSWHSAGGTGLPHQASKSEQIARAKVLQSRQGWGAWPACTSNLGIR